MNRLWNDSWFLHKLLPNNSVIWLSLILDLEIQHSFVYILANGKVVIVDCMVDTRKWLSSKLFCCIRFFCLSLSLSIWHYFIVISNDTSIMSSPEGTSAHLEFDIHYPGVLSPNDFNVDKKILFWFSNCYSPGFFFSFLSLCLRNTSYVTDLWKFSS